MTTINLRDFYPWYRHNEFVEVPDKVAAALIADKRYEKSCRRNIYRNKAQYSLNCDDGIETAITFTEMSPHEVLEYKWMFCRLCRALNSLPEVQARRLEAHYQLGRSRKKIAKLEGVSEIAVHKSITKGLAAMRKFLKEF